MRTHIFTGIYTPENTCLQEGFVHSEANEEGLRVRPWDLFLFLKSWCTVCMYAFCASVDYPGVAVSLHVWLHCNLYVCSVCIHTRIFMYAVYAYILVYLEYVRSVCMQCMSMYAVYAYILVYSHACILMIICIIYMYVVFAFEGHREGSVCLVVDVYCAWVWMCSRVRTHMYNNKFIYRIHICGFCIRRLLRRGCVFGCVVALHVCMHMYTCMCAHVYSSVHISNMCMRFLHSQTIGKGLCVWLCGCVARVYACVPACILMSICIMYMYAHKVRFQKRILLIVQYKYSKSCSGDCMCLYHVQPIAFGVSFNPNLQSQSPWSLFIGM